MFKTAVLHSDFPSLCTLEGCEVVPENLYLDPFIFTRSKVHIEEKKV